MNSNIKSYIIYKNKKEIIFQLKFIIPKFKSDEQVIKEFFFQLNPSMPPKWIFSQNRILKSRRLNITRNPFCVTTASRFPFYNFKIKEKKINKQLFYFLNKQNYLLLLKTNM